MSIWRVQRRHASTKRRARHLSPIQKRRCAKKTYQPQRKAEWWRFGAPSPTLSLPSPSCILHFTIEISGRTHVVNTPRPNVRTTLYGSTEAIRIHTDCRGKLVRAGVSFKKADCTKQCILFLALLPSCSTHPPDVVMVLSYFALGLDRWWHCPPPKPTGME